MKPWQWAALGLGAIVLIIVIMKSSQPAQPAGSINGSLQEGALFGGLFKGLFSGSSSKVTAPSNGAPPAGSSGSTDPGYSYNGLSASSYGSQYSAAMGSTGETSSMNAGSGGTNFNGGLSAMQTSDPLGIGTLSGPNFNIGTGGADFSN